MKHIFKRGKVAVRTSVTLGVASSVANDVIMRIAGLVAHSTGRRCGNWRHVATGCNALVMLKIRLCLHSIFTCLCCWLCGQTRRKPSREKEDDSDGDSSVCEELIEEPVKEDLTSKEQTTNEDRFVVMRT